MNNLFEYYIETDTFHLKYAKGEPAVKEQEFHDYHEFVLFLGGNAHFISKNIQQKLIPGTIILIPKAHFHQFLVNQSQDYTRCIIGFRESDEISEIVSNVMTDIKAITTPPKKILTVFEDLMGIAESNLSDEEKKLFIKASLAHILVYFKQFGPNESKHNITISPVVRSAINHIDKNYMNNLSVDEIAAYFHVSPSTLAHKFSKELNISIYRYITKKRLSVAHELIKGGESLSVAAASSGFNDYSCFYRLYKKYYSY